MQTKLPLDKVVLIGLGTKIKAHKKNLNHISRKDILTHCAKSGLNQIAMVYSDTLIDSSYFSHVQYFPSDSKITKIKTDEFSII